MCSVCSEKQLLQKFREALLLTRATGLQYTFCNATKNELLTKFLEGAFKTENFQEVMSDEVPYQKVADLQTTAFSLACS